MDRLALQILTTELRKDSVVIAKAARCAQERLVDKHAGHLEACGFELNRLYNILEKGFERICSAFENHFDKSGDYHERLMDRVALTIPEVRPSFLPDSARSDVRELKSFRRVFRHAYDLELREDRLTDFVRIADRVSMAFAEWIESFAAQVRTALDAATNG